MPRRSSAADLLVDTSVAVALSVADHEEHEATTAALAGRRLGLSGHAAFETFSVLTRLPPPARRPPATIADLLRVSFPASCHLGALAAGELMSALASAGVAGGAVYDALVAACAVEHGLPLATRDARALPTYRAFGVRLELLP